MFVKARSRNDISNITRTTLYSISTAFLSFSFCFCVRSRYASVHSLSYSSENLSTVLVGRLVSLRSAMLGLSFLSFSLASLLALNQSEMSKTFVINYLHYICHGSRLAILLNMSKLYLRIKLTHQNNNYKVKVKVKFLLFSGIQSIQQESHIKIHN